MAQVPGMAGDRTGVILRPFRRGDTDAAHHLSQEAGWPHRPEDWDLTLSVSDGVVAEEHGRVIGCALLSDLGAIATINMVIVDAARRGEGLGRRMMLALLDRAPEREVRLVATRDGLPLYRRTGFVDTGTVVQHQGIAHGAAPALEVWRGGAADLDALCRADRAATGMERGDLLRRIAASGTLLSCAGGHALIRRFGRGEVLGPVLASDARAAMALMQAAARHCEGRFLRVDLSADTGLQDGAEALGLAFAGEGYAMTRNPAPRPTGDMRSWALVSQALG